MRTNEPYKLSINNLNSLADLAREKEKLQMEITRKEEGIKSNYQGLVHQLSFRNLMGTLIEEVSTSTTVIGNLFSLGRDFFAKHKKKKKDKHQTPESGPQEQAE